MRARTTEEAFAARPRWRVMAMVVILGGGGTAPALTPSGASRDGSRPTDTVAPTPVVKEEEPTRSVWDGVYTEEQAARGRRIFRTHCADCHQPGEFKMGYRTADDIFSSRDEMPQSSPDSLSAQEYAELIAYIFEANGLPSGEEELQGDPEILKRIRIEAEKPSGR